MRITDPASPRRLHPLTPVLRAGRVVPFVVGGAGIQGQSGARTLFLLFVGLLALVLTLGWLGWRATTFRITDGELQVDSGVLSRRARRVPLSRVQSVDVVRGPVARLLGLAELRLEVVGGASTEAPLAYLTEDQAEAWRDLLLAGAERQPEAAPRSEQVLVQVPSGALLTSVLLGAPVALLVVGVPVLLVTAVVDASAVPAVLFAAGPFLLAAGGAVVGRLLSDYGATVSEVPEGLQLRSGLLATRTQTVPPGRVQAVRVLEPLLWRRRDWVRVEVDVAGYAAGGQEAAATASLLPVAPRALADALVARVLGGPLPVADSPAPPAARHRAPLSFRRLAYGVDERHLVATSGVLTTTTDVVPLAKVQSLRLTAGPWQRRLGLASVTADSAGRRLARTVARHRDADEAQALLQELTERCRAARSRRTPQPTADSSAST